MTLENKIKKARGAKKTFHPQHILLHLQFGDHGSHLLSQAVYGDATHLLHIFHQFEQLLCRLGCLLNSAVDGLEVLIEPVEGSGGGV